MSAELFIGQWVGAAISVGTLIVLWRKMSGISERREISPQPLTVREEAAFAIEDHAHADLLSREEHAAICGGRANEITRLDATLREIDRQHASRTEGLRQEIKADVGQIYNRIELKAQGTDNRLQVLISEVGRLSGLITSQSGGPHAN